MSYTTIGPPEEFVADPRLQAPESSLMILFGADMLGLPGLVILFRRRLLRTVQ
jgi:hypothetical protein